MPIPASPGPPSLCLSRTIACNVHYLQSQDTNHSYRRRVRLEFYSHSHQPPTGGRFLKPGYSPLAKIFPKSIPLPSTFILHIATTSKHPRISTQTHQIETPPSSWYNLTTSPQKCLLDAFKSIYINFGYVIINLILIIKNILTFAFQCAIVVVCRTTSIENSRYDPVWLFGLLLGWVRNKKRRRK